MNLWTTIRSFTNAPADAAGAPAFATGVALTEEGTAPVVEFRFAGLTVAGAPTSVTFYFWRMDDGYRIDLLGTRTVLTAALATKSPVRFANWGSRVYVTIAFTGGAGPTLSGEIQATRTTHLPPDIDDSLLMGLATEATLLLIETHVGSIDTNVGLIETHIGTIDTNVGLIETHIGTIDTNVGLIETHIGTIDTNLASIIVAEDAAHTPGEYGVKSWRRRISPCASSAGTDGDWATPNQDADGFDYMVSKAFDAATSADKSYEVAAVDSHYAPVDFSGTGAAAGTTYYYLDCAGYGLFSIHGWETAGDPSYKVWVTLQDDGTAPASCTYVDVTAALFGSASITLPASPGDLRDITLSRTWKYVRIGVTWTTNPSTWVLYMRKKAM